MSKPYDSHRISTQNICHAPINEPPEAPAEKWVKCIPRGQSCTNCSALGGTVHTLLNEKPQ